jgi:hypothetical protein
MFGERSVAARQRDDGRGRYRPHRKGFSFEEVGEEERKAVQFKDCK